MTAKVDLPEQMNTDSAEALLAELSALRGSPVTLCAAKVQFLGGLCFQILMSARDCWQAEGHELALGATSPAFETAMKRLGMPPQSFSGGL